MTMTKATALGFLGLLCMFLPLTSCAQDTNGSGEPRAQGTATDTGYDFVADWTNRNQYCGGGFQDFAISTVALTSLSDYEERSMIERSGYDAELVKWILFSEDLNFVIATPRSHLGPEPDFRTNEEDAAWSRSASECSAKTSRIYALPVGDYVELPFRSPHCGDFGGPIEPADINITIYEVNERVYIALSWPHPAGGMHSLYQVGSEGVLKVGDRGC